MRRILRCAQDDRSALRMTARAAWQSKIQDSKFKKKPDSRNSHSILKIQDSRFKIQEVFDDLVLIF